MSPETKSRLRRHGGEPGAVDGGQGAVDADETHCRLLLERRQDQTGESKAIARRPERGTDATNVPSLFHAGIRPCQNRIQYDHDSLSSHERGVINFGFELCLFNAEKAPVSVEFLQELSINQVAELKEKLHALQQQNAQKREAVAKQSEGSNQQRSEAQLSCCLSL